MQPMVRGLTWPAASLIVIGTAHLIGELLRPELHEAIDPAVAMPIYLVVGAMAAMATTRAGGGPAQALLAGAILGLLPVGLQVLGFGLIAGQGADSVTTAAALGWLGIFWGGALGTGIAGSRVTLDTES